MFQFNQTKLLINKPVATINGVPCLASEAGGQDGQCGHGTCRDNICVCEDYWLNEILGMTEANATTFIVDLLIQNHLKNANLLRLYFSACVVSIGASLLQV